jgi:hypothetical protein
MRDLMRAELVLYTVILALYGPMAVKAGQPYLPGAKEASEIIKWTDKAYGGCPHYEYQSNGKKCLVLLPNVASGLALRLILVYALDNTGWSLVVLRHTNTSTVKIEQNGDLLMFKSKSGKQLMSFPITSLEFQFDPEEQ